MAPQQWMTWPLTYDESSDARKRATLATSSGVPPLLRGICFSHSSRTFSGSAFVMSVMMNPGATRTHFLGYGFGQTDKAGFGSRVVALPCVS